MDTTRLDALQGLATTWFETAQQGVIQAELDRKRGYGKLADILAGEAQEDFDDAQAIVKRLVELGYTPKPAAEALPSYTDIKAQLEATYQGFIGANEGALDRLAALFADDYTTRKLIQGFIIEEAGHKLWLEKHLSLINDIGMENYLIEMIGQVND